MLKNRNNYILHYLGLLIIAIISVYYLPQPIEKIFFLFIIYSIYKSDNPIIYILFVLIFADNAYILYREGSDFISFGKFSVGFIEIVSIVLFLKYRSSFFRTRLYFSKGYYLYVFWLLLLILLGLIMGMRVKGTAGGGMQQYLNTFYVILLIPLFITLPYAMLRKNNLYIIAKVILIPVIICSISILFRMITRGDFIQVFSSTESRFFESEDGIRAAQGYFLNHISFIIGIMLIKLKDYKFINKIYCYLLVFLPVLNIILGATRGWMLSLVMMYFIISFTSGAKTLIRTITGTFGIILFLVLLSTQVPVVAKQVGFALERFSTIKELQKGDISMGGTDRRYTERYLPVYERFVENPLTGWGYTSTAHEYKDSHVGWINLLMSSGVIGLLILLYFLYSLSLRSRFTMIRNKIVYFRSKFYIIISSVVGLLIVHSTSGQLFGYINYTIGYHRYEIYSLGFIFGIYTIITYRKTY